MWNVCVCVCVDGNCKFGCVFIYYDDDDDAAQINAIIINKHRKKEHAHLSWAGHSWPPSTRAELDAKRQAARCRRPHDGHDEHHEYDELVIVISYFY